MAYRVRSKGAALLLRDYPKDLPLGASLREFPMYRVGSEWIAVKHEPLPDALLEVEEGDAPRADQYVRENTITHGSVEPSKPIEDETEPGFLTKTAKKIVDVVKEDEDKPRRATRKKRKTKKK